jgi:hypothetical protein
VPHEFVGAAPVFSREVPQCLDRYVDANLVAVLEAIRNRLRG